MASGCHVGPRHSHWWVPGHGWGGEGRGGEGRGVQGLDLGLKGVGRPILCEKRPLAV